MPRDLRRIDQGQQSPHGFDSLENAEDQDRLFFFKPEEMVG